MSGNEELDRSLYFTRSQMARSNDDPSIIKQRDNQSDTKLKYVLTDFSDLLTKQVKEGDTYGLFAATEFSVPRDKIDESTSLRQGAYTNDRARETWGDSPLPLNTLPARYQGKYGDPDIESGLQLHKGSPFNKKAVNPRDPNVHNRTFAIFESTGTEVPNPYKSVEDPYFVRGGTITRRQIVTKKSL